MPIQRSGTFPLNNDLEAFSSEEFMTILPSIANFRSLRDDLTILIRPLNL